MLQFHSKRLVLVAIRSLFSDGGVSSEMAVLSLFSSTTLFSVVSITQMCVSPTLCIGSIASSGRSCLSDVLSSLLLSKRENASAARCSMHALRTTSN